MLEIVNSVKFDSQLNKIGSIGVPVDILICKGISKTYLRIENWCYELKCLCYSSFTNVSGALDELLVFDLDSPLVDYIQMGDCYWVWQNGSGLSDKILFAINLTNMTEDILEMRIETVTENHVFGASSAPSWGTRIKSGKACSFERKTGKLTIYDTTERVGEDIRVLDRYRVVEVPQIDLNVVMKEFVFG